MNTTQLIEGDVMPKPGSSMSRAEAEQILVDAEKRRLVASGMSYPAAAARAETTVSWLHPAAPHPGSKAEIMFDQTNQFPVDD